VVAGECGVEKISVVIVRADTIWKTGVYADDDGIGFFNEGVLSRLPV
jgi:hypothetical protein